MKLFDIAPGFILNKDMHLLPELKKADVFLTGFDWRSLDNQETFDSVFMINLSRMEHKHEDDFNNFIEMSKNSSGLLEIIKKLNGQDVNALDCFRWIVDNIMQIVTESEKYIKSEIRQLNEPWEISMDQ